MEPLPSSGAMSVSYRSSDTRMLVGLALAIGGAYVGYRYWYVPMKMREEYDRQLALARQQGYSGDALAQLGGTLCTVIGAKYGVPPQASGSICQPMGQLAADLVKQLPGLVGGVGAGVGSGVAAIGRGTGSAIVSVGEAPLKVLGYGVGGVWGGTKTVVHDVYGATKDVVRDVVSVPKTVVKGIGKALSHIF